MFNNDCHGLHILKWIILGLIFAFFFGWIVMLLWNWLMPSIFSLGTITYWQAWGLVLLSHLLFKTGHGHHPKSSHHHECGPGLWKEKFRSKMKDRFACGEKEDSSNNDN